MDSLFHGAEISPACTRRGYHIYRVPYPICQIFGRPSYIALLSGRIIIDNKRVIGSIGARYPLRHPQFECAPPSPVVALDSEALAALFRKPIDRVLRWRPRKNGASPISKSGNSSAKESSAKSTSRERNRFDSILATTL